MSTSASFASSIQLSQQVNGTGIQTNATYSNITGTSIALIDMYDQFLSSVLTLHSADNSYVQWDKWHFRALPGCLKDLRDLQ